jgi:hypothetical protein
MKVYLTQKPHRLAIIATSSTLAVLLLVYAYANFLHKPENPPLQNTGQSKQEALPPTIYSQNKEKLQKLIKGYNPQPRTPEQAARNIRLLLDDPDNDGLPTLSEINRNTNPYNADTDGDGYKDGEEILAGHDPTKPAPHDKIETQNNQQSSQNQSSQASTGGPLPVSAQAMADFLAAVPLQAFEKEVNIAPEELNVVKQTGRGAVIRYLDQISPAHNPQLAYVSAEDIISRFRKLALEKDPHPLREIYDKLERNLAILKAAPVPESLVGLHKRYVSAAKDLRNAVQALLFFHQDPSGAVLAAKIIDAAGGALQAIGKEIRKLDKRYGIS